MVEKQDAIAKSHIASARAADDLRRQVGIIIQEDKNTAMAAYPVEFLTAKCFVDMKAGKGNRTSVLITAARARCIDIDPGKASVIRIDADNLSYTQLQALADPLADQSLLPKVKAEPASEPQYQAVTLAKVASLLPAMLAIEGNASLKDAPVFSGWNALCATDVKNYIGVPMVDLIETAHAKLPVDVSENGVIHSFRSRYCTSVHLALVIGDISKTKAPLTRIHSSCVTGDILGSMRCDCGDQLHMALSQIARSGSGILLYLNQEGRGIGITNKLRAYQLQERGVDTYDANLMLGYEEDERDFSIAGAILKKLGVNQIRMLTNNPHKMSAIEKTGVKIAERVPLVASSGQYNHAYLDAKVKKSGHML